MAQFWCWDLPPMSPSPLPVAVLSYFPLWVEATDHPFIPYSERGRPRPQRVTAAVRPSLMKRREGKKKALTHEVFVMFMAQERLVIIQTPGRLCGLKRERRHCCMQRKRQASLCLWSLLMRSFVHVHVFTVNSCCSVWQARLEKNLKLSIQRCENIVHFCSRSWCCILASCICDFSAASHCKINGSGKRWVPVADRGTINTPTQLLPSADRMRLSPHRHAPPLSVCHKTADIGPVNKREIIL